ncbi:MAG: glycosyltransferase family 4 protein [Bryobacteraceae bacterium]
MRVLHFDTGRQMRGGQWQVLLLMRGLRARGIDNVLLGRGPLLERARKEGFGAAEATWTNMLLESPGAGLMHAHTGRGHALAAACGMIPWVRAPLVVSRRVAFRPRKGIGAWWKYKRAERVVAVSEYVKQKLVAWGVDEAKIRVVPDGAEALPRIAWDGRIVAISSSDRKKGGPLLRKTNLDVSYMKDLAEELPGARVMVYLSDSEGLGSAVLSAMSAGVPVVASRTGGLVELIEDGVTGLLVDNNVGAVEEAVRRLQADEQLSSRLAEAALARYRARYTTEHMVEETLRVYKECARWK